MRKLIVDGAEIPIYADEVNGETVYLFAERNDEDGGIITNTLVHNGDGSFYNYRTWRGVGVEATAEQKVAGQAEAMSRFETLPRESIENRATEAAKPKVSGKLHH